eukprot:TRINITY_DN18165_c0_g1_i1.p1 TRINITY_DN18165_c0_g1~~TRINITY_DN18165_c0_g1_i1.p1  ORF type:complete len:525 (+),score=52.49 TRINITY_DN18165_c0_g1_i1:49-1623(+)
MRRPPAMRPRAARGADGGGLRELRLRSPLRRGPRRARGGAAPLRGRQRGRCGAHRTVRGRSGRQGSDRRGGGALLHLLQCTACSTVQRARPERRRGRRPARGAGAEHVRLQPLQPADCVAPQEAPHPPPAAIPHPGAAPPAAAPALLSDLAALESRVDRCAAALGELQSRGEDRRRPERTLRREQRLAAELQQYSGLAPGAEGGETCADCRLPCRGTPFCTVSGKQHPGPWGGAPARRAARRSQPGGDGADAAAGASGSPGAASAGAPSGALSAELGELLRLRREGGLTDAEFAEAKACVLAAARAQSPPRPETQGGADHSPSPQLAQTAPPPAAPQLFSEPEPLVLHPPPPPPQPPPPPPQPPPSRTAVRRASSAAASSRGGLHRPETDDALAELRRPLLSGARSDSRSSDSPMSQLPASLQGAHLPAERVGAASPQSPASAESPACGPDPEECPGSAVAGGDNQSTASGEQPSQSAAEGGGGGRPSEGGAEGGPQHVEAGSSAAPEAAPADTEGSKRCCTLM